jgi:SAM-dependent methyltransferase
MARGFLRPEDDVIDAACGTGYGTEILSDACHQVLGFDIDLRALEIASARYNTDNTRYINLDFDHEKGLESCDVAVSFETIEHLKYPDVFAENLKACAKRLIIMSAPIVPTVGKNPHHLHDFTEKELKGLFIDKEWTLWEQMRQGPYLVLIIYAKSRENFGTITFPH